MTIRPKTLSSLTRCLLFSFAITSPGMTWGCGGGAPSQIELDEEGKKKLQEAQDSMRKSMEKRQALDKLENKKGRKR